MDLGDAGTIAAGFALAMAVVRFAEKALLRALDKNKPGPPDITPALVKISESQERITELLIEHDTKLDAVARSVEIIRERRAS